MQNVLWISRHLPSQAQLNEIKDRGQQIVDLDKGIEIGSINLKEYSDNMKVFSQIRELVEKHDAKAVYGVFATPVQALLARDLAYLVDYTQNPYDSEVGWERVAEHGIPCFSAFNVARSVEGGKPTFEHKGFYVVGALELL